MRLNTGGTGEGCKEARGTPGWTSQGNHFDLVFDGLGKLEDTKRAAMESGDEHSAVKLHKLRDSGEGPGFRRAVMEKTSPSGQAK